MGIRRFGAIPSRIFRCYNKARRSECSSLQSFSSVFWAVSSSQQLNITAKSVGNAGPRLSTWLMTSAMASSASSPLRRVPSERSVNDVSSSFPRAYATPPKAMRISRVLDMVSAMKKSTSDSTADTIERYSCTPASWSSITKSGR